MDHQSYDRPYSASASSRGNRERELTLHLQGRAVDAYREALRAIPKQVQEELDREDSGHLFQEYLTRLLLAGERAKHRATTHYSEIWPVPPYGNRSDVLFLLHIVPTPFGDRHVAVFSATLASEVSMATTVCLTNQGKLLFWSNHHQAEHWTNQPVAIEAHCLDCMNRVSIETLEALLRILSG